MNVRRFLSLCLSILMIAALFAGCAVENPPSGTAADGTDGADAASEQGTADGYEEGTSDSDNIVNTTAADKVILVVSFGTSFNESRSLTIGGIEAAIQKAYPDYQVRRAFIAV